ncbi:A/G-specific adenine glycosylase [Lapidilactobacillus luobeiensis]|uniref:A/G-specific adenine glycosylase n=1 Tax=Lapidilactobacillus luobeiensis TaxID=2950371 RepID=UPI0021C2C216|nr:A/G-specific adenine glycosylase [Lapidilactobacillus luobeiensis]
MSKTQTTVAKATVVSLADHYLTWSPEKIAAFRQTLLSWYDAEGRDLPWRQDQEPYHILLSEIMLQQTQVQTVIPYYQRFLAALPTIQDLATVPEEQLLQLWSGLGYYSRARNLQKAAQQLVHDYAGVWPRTAAELVDLAGVGPYTAGAIASIAFGEAVPAVDGNAFRVFARLLEIDLDITKPQTRLVFSTIIARLIDPARPGDFNQAIMDIGTRYMTAKNPDETQSPLRRFDASAAAGTSLQYPVRQKKARPVVQHYFALAIHSPAGWLLLQRPTTGMLARLWLFPLLDQDELLTASQADQPDKTLTTANPLAAPAKNGAGQPTDQVTDQKNEKQNGQPAQRQKSQPTELATELSDPVVLLAAVTTAWQALSGWPTPLPLRDPHLPLVKHTFTHRQWQLHLLTAELPQVPDLANLPGRWFAAADFPAAALPTVQRKMLQALDLPN